MNRKNSTPNVHNASNGSNMNHRNNVNNAINVEFHQAKEISLSGTRMTFPHNPRRGASFLEKIMILVFLAMFLTTFYAIISILKPQRPTAGQGSALLNQYQTLLERMNQDIRFADSAKVGDGGQNISIRRNDGSLLVYRIDRGTLFREGDGERREVLLEGVASGQFRIHSEYPDLITVVMIPSEQMGTPFFTSFAIRRESLSYAPAGGKP
ncbi:MAG: hypothetical protein WA705_07725 [Candidatus Ozemobacteraceae bacterium]